MTNQESLPHLEIFCIGNRDITRLASSIDRDMCSCVLSPTAHYRSGVTEISAKRFGVLNRRDAGATANLTRKGLAEPSPLAAEGLRMGHRKPKVYYGRPPASNVDVLDSETSPGLRMQLSRRAIHAELLRPASLES